MSFFDFSISHAASQINERNTLMIHQCHFCLAAQKVKWKGKKKSKYLLNSYLRTVHWISQWLSVLSVPWSKAFLKVLCISVMSTFSVLFPKIKQIDKTEKSYNLPHQSFLTSLPLHWHLSLVGLLLDKEAGLGPVLSPGNAAFHSTKSHP